MATLDELFIGKNFGQASDERLDMRIVAEVVSEYLNEYPLVTSRQINGAVHCLNRVVEGERPFRHLGMGTGNIYYCASRSVNPFLKSSESFLSMGVKEAAQKYLVQSGYEVQISEKGILDGAAIVFYKEEEKLRNYFLEHAKLVKRVAHYEFL